jgi:hypothetical protein
MVQPETSAVALTHTRNSDHPEANSSGISWSAVIAGAFVTAALYLILLSLGAGLGLSSTSVWSNVGITAATLGTASILWLIFVEIVSSSMGGYLAGRLRTRWTIIHGDEVYFRDTAHGFLSWSVALVVTAALLGSAASAMVGASKEPGTADTKASSGSNAYFVDSLLRSNSSKQETDSVALHNEVATIFASALKRKELSSDDKAYLDRVVSARSGLDQGSSDKRVSDVYTSALEATEAARKALAHTLLWIFVALLIGAFCASFAGTIGGKQRDKVVIL